MDDTQFIVSVRLRRKNNNNKKKQKMKQTNKKSPTAQKKHNFPGVTNNRK